MIMNIFNRSIPLLLLLIFAVSAESTGIIKGTVSDIQTKEPLPGVNIVVLGEQNLGASSDTEGNFRIQNVPTGNKRVQFSFVGYETRTVSDILVTSTRPALINVELREKAFETESIEVTAGYFVEAQQPQPSTFALSKEEIRRFPGGFEDVVRTVSTLPGVTISGNNSRNDLLVRGGGPTENLYIINNIEIPNINHFGTQGTSSGSISFINLDFVEDVSFSTGGFSARYGDKMSSVLDIDLAEGRNDRFGGKALVSATQFGANAEGPFGGNGSFIFSARQSYLDLIFKAANLPFVPVYTDFNFVADYNITNRDRLTVLGLAALDRVERDQSTAENRVVNAGILDNTQNQWIGGLNYRRSLGNGYFNVAANLNLNQYRFSQVDSARIEYFDSVSDEQEIGIKVQRFWAASERLGILAGIDHEWVATRNQVRFAQTIYDRNGRPVNVDSLGLPRRSDQDINSSKSAAFLEADWTLHPKVSLNAGLRMDYYDFLNDPFYPAPRLAFKFKPTNRLSFKLSGGIYYQSPAYVWIINRENRDLKALRNTMSVAGVEYMLRADTRMSFEAFYKDYGRLPTGTVPGVNDYLVITNTGSEFGGRENNFQSFGYNTLLSEGYGHAFGFEWLLQKRFSDIPVYGQFSLAYSKARFTAANGETHFSPFDQRFVLNLSGGYVVNDVWEISGKFRYFSGLPYTPVYKPSQNPSGRNTIQNLPQEYLSERLPAAHHLDLRVDRYFNFDKWTLIAFIDIQNIYNYKIPLRPRYDFWNDKIINNADIGILPSIGISLEY